MPTFRQLFSGKRRLLFISAVVVAGAALLGMNATLRSADDAKPASGIEIKNGDHICLIGNTLADRMQHDGWLETYLYSRFPKHDLVVRDLGFSGDELTCGCGRPGSAARTSIWRCKRPT